MSEVLDGKVSFVFLQATEKITGKPYLLCLPLLGAEGRTRGEAIIAADTRRRGCVGGPHCLAAVALFPIGKAEIAATEIISRVTFYSD